MYAGAIAVAAVPVLSGSDALPGLLTNVVRTLAVGFLAHSLVDGGDARRQG